MTELLIVTTRSRLKSVVSFPSMMVATRRVRRQLANTEAVVRWASVVSSPTEFWTITAWRSRHEMQEFMRSDAHGDIMWGFSRLLSSLWLVRWHPTEHEVGSWSGVSFAPEVAPPAPSQPAGHVLPPVLTGIVDGAGMINFGGSPEARRAREQLKGVGGAVLSVQTNRRQFPACWWSMRRHRRRLFADPALLRSVIGIGSGGSCYMLCVWRTPEDAARMLHSDWATALQSRYGELYWANEWIPENEFGNWDGLRLRGDQRRVPHQPDAA
jgi:hypothetical protein